jgi:dUTP pyrophosphatase
VNFFFPFFFFCFTRRYLRSSSAEDKTIPAKGKALVDTQISVAVPVGTYGRVAPRSGLGEKAFPAQLNLLITPRVFANHVSCAASKFMIDTGAGVIDADYRGLVFVLLFNHSDADFQGKVHMCCSGTRFGDDNFNIVSEGDRIAQLIVEKIETPDVLEVAVSFYISISV